MSHPTPRFALAAALLLLTAPLVRAENWPQWRGPTQNGISQETKLPATWGQGKNIAWELDLPGKGGSTPAVWGDHIFLTCADGSDVVLVSVSTAGKLQWKKKISKMFRPNVRGDEANDASNSPCTDGKHVYVYCGTGDFVCFDFQGNEVWHFNTAERYSKHNSFHGLHTSPLLHEGRLYLALLHHAGQFVIALDAATGKEIWKVTRPTDAKGESVDAYGTPALWQDGKDSYIVVLGADYCTAHRLTDGSEVWRLTGFNPGNKDGAFRIITSPVASKDLIVVPSARSRMVIGVKPEAKGRIDPGSPMEQWRIIKGSPDVTSPLIHDGLVYLCWGNADNTLLCLDAKTGQQKYSHVFPFDADRRFRASPVYADGKVYLVAREGQIHVVKAGPTFDLVATNRLPDEFTASPAISNGRIYLHGFKKLYAVSDGGK